MENTDPLLDAVWFTTPFQGPLDELYELVETIESRWAEKGVSDPGVPPSPVYLDALQVSVRTMEQAMEATWAADEWHAYAQTVSEEDEIELPAAILQAEYRLVSTWNAQVVHAFATAEPELTQQLAERALSPSNPLRMATIAAVTTLS